MIIGDRALNQRKTSEYIYDLGLEWKKFTGLPFVFAAWVSNKKLDEDFINSFNESNALGLDHIEQIVANNAFPGFDLQKYYTRHISYFLTEEKKKGLKSFLNKLKEKIQYINSEF